MEDKHQLLSHEEPAQKKELGIPRCLSCSPDHPPAGRTVTPDGTGQNPSAGIGPTTRLPDSSHCRECLGAMAHRLAQPITALRGGIELGLMGKRSAADYQSLLEQSLQLADSMVQLIVSLRDLGEAGAPGGASECVLLEATAKQVLAEMGGMAETRDLRLRLKAEETVKIYTNPDRLRDALQSLLAWVIQNSAGGGVIAVEISASDSEARVFMSLPRMDLQYLQVKVLEDITNPGLLFSHAAKNGALGWAINQRLADGVGGKLEILTEGPDVGCIRVRFPLAQEGSAARDLPR